MESPQSLQVREASPVGNSSPAAHGLEHLWNDQVLSWGEMVKEERTTQMMRTKMTNYQLYQNQEFVLHKLSGAVSRSNENSRRKSTTRTRMLNVQLLTEWQWPKYVWPQMFYNIDGNSLKQHARLWNDIHRNTAWKP